MPLDASSRTISLRELGERFSAQIQGDPATEISSVATLDSARRGQITFVANPKYRARLATTQASVVILKPELASAAPCAALLSANPYALFAKIAALLSPLPRAIPGVHPSAVVDPSARLGSNVSIGPNCWIGADAQIGADSVLHANVSVYPRSQIGARAIVHAGAVIGADGFGMAPENGRWLKIPQTGRAILGDDVEVGANTCIDRGALDDTFVGDGVKLDNLIQIGHNARVGAHTAMAAGVIVAGSAVIGERCMIRVGALILGHLIVCDDAEVSAATMVTKSIRKPGAYTGVFPFDSNDAWLKNAAHIRHLDDLARRVKVLEQQLNSQGEKPHD